MPIFHSNMVFLHTRPPRLRSDNFDYLSIIHTLHRIFSLPICLSTVSLYHIWREKNSKKYEDPPSTSQRLIKIIDKTIQNIINSIWRMLAMKNGVSLSSELEPNKISKYLVSTLCFQYSVFNPPL